MFSPDGLCQSQSLLGCGCWFKDKGSDDLGGQPSHSSFGGHVMLWLIETAESPEHVAQSPLHLSTVHRFSWATDHCGKADLPMNVQSAAHAIFVYMCFHTSMMYASPVT